MKTNMADRPNIISSPQSYPVHAAHRRRDTVQSILMPHWKIILTYDGTPYNGWQVQPNLPTVQGTLAHVIHHITGESVLPQGSGRTDTGVHALAQVATFSLSVPIPAPNLHHALNRALPPSIRVLSVEAVPAEFHARHNALRKTYEYRILPGNRICSPMLAPFVWACPLALDLPRLQQAAAYILGTHDFTSFAASDPDLTTRNQSAATATFDADYFAQLNSEIVTDAETESVAESHSPESDSRAIASIEDQQLPATPIGPGKETVISTLSAVERAGAFAAVVEKPASLPLSSHSPNTPAHATNTRTIHHSAWHQQEDLLIYRITGSGFLHHMVRNLVGTFVEAGTGRISPDAIPTILAARNRSAAGPTAPARGLFLVEVAY
jgi:tRNA pseudouridine38-40 synthase